MILRNWNYRTGPLATPTRFKMSFPGSHPALGDHFPGNPIVPGALLLGSLQIELKRHLGNPVSAISKLRFIHAIPPDQLLEVSLDPTDDATYRLHMASRDELVLKCLVHCRLDNAAQ